MLTIKEMFQDISSINEAVLVKLSDKLWEIGTLEEIREQVSPDLFLLHIGINMIGNWKCDGWWYVICEQAKLVPSIPKALEALGLYDLEIAFTNVISLFPDYTVFSNEEDSYYDIINFLQSTYCKVSDERLNRISFEKRKEMVKSIRQKVDTLELLTEPLWGEGAEQNGWKQILDFVILKKQKNM
ncbi:MAG: hypothetical protein J6C19_06605 [Lachnospiraceae bacterium]|nr:hypothetical protein [Lachnospiraceae bacterium]